MTNAIIFVVLILAALILVVWYAQSIRPTRYIIGSVTEDIDELSQHFSNACGVSVYNATYLFQTTTAQFIINESAQKYCIISDTFASCKDIPCFAREAFVALDQDQVLARIHKSVGGPVLVEVVS